MGWNSIGGLIIEFKNSKIWQQYIVSECAMTTNSKLNLSSTCVWWHRPMLHFLSLSQPCFSAYNVCALHYRCNGTAHSFMPPSEVSLLICHKIYAMSFNILPYVKVLLSYRNFMIYLQKTRTLKVFLLIP